MIEDNDDNSEGGLLIINAQSRFAFVEFEDPRDAEDALNEMHGRRVEGHTLTIQVRYSPVP